MTQIEDRELDEVAGASTAQQEIFDFVERVRRESQRMIDQTAEPIGF